MQEQGKVFQSAGAGRFQFENQNIEPTPEQLAEQERQKQAAGKRKDAAKSSLRIAIGAIIIAAIGVIILLIVTNLMSRDRVILEMGEFSFTQSDLAKYREGMREHVAENPGASFGDDLDQTALDDLTYFIALKYYASPEQCNIQVSDNDVARLNSIPISGEGATAGQVLDARLGESVNSNFRRVRAENVAYRNMLSNCLLTTREIFAMTIYFEALYFRNLPADELQVAYDTARARLKNEILPLFEQGLSNKEIAARADWDRVYDQRVPEIDDEGMVPAYGTQPMLVARMFEYRPRSGFFNDVEMNHAANPGELVSLNEVADNLTDVGTYTDVLTSMTQEFIILRLEAVSEHEFTDWTDFLVQMAKKRRFARGNEISSEYTLARSSSIADFLTPEVYANVSGCNHLAEFEITFRDEAGAGVPGVQVTNDQDQGGTCGGGRLVSSGTSDANGKVTILVNCNRARSISATLPAGYSFSDGSTSVSGKPMSFFGNVRMSEGDNVIKFWSGTEILKTTGAWVVDGFSQVGKNGGNWCSNCGRSNPLRVQKGDTIDFRHYVQNRSTSTLSAEFKWWVDQAGPAVIGGWIGPAKGPWDENLAPGQFTSWQDKAATTISAVDTNKLKDGDIVCQALLWQGISSSNRNGVGRTTPNNEVCAEIWEEEPYEAYDCENIRFESTVSQADADQRAGASTAIKEQPGGPCHEGTPTPNPGACPGSAGECGSVGEFITRARNTTVTAAQANQWRSSGFTYEKVASFVKATCTQATCQTSAPGGCWPFGGGCCNTCNAFQNPEWTQLTKTLEWINNGDCNNGSCNFTPESNPVWAKPNDRIEFQHINDKSGWWNIVSASPAVRARDLEGACRIDPFNRNSLYTANQLAGVPADCTGVNVGNRFVLWSPNGGTTTAGGRTVVRTLAGTDVGTTWRQEMTAATTWACEKSFEARWTGPACVSGCGSCPANAATFFGSTDVEVGGGGASYAVVKVPYNHITESITTLDISGELDSGISIGVTVDIDVRPRENPIVSVEDYATITHPTQWRLVKFLIAPGGSVNGAGFSATGGDAPGTAANMCQYYRGSALTYTYNGANIACVDIASGSGEIFNQGGNLRGERKQVLRDNYFADDVPPGTQICYATGVYPASSLGVHDNIQDTEEKNRTAMEFNEGEARWRYGEPKCVTVGKKPKVQIMGAGTNIPGDVSTSQTIKSFGSAGNALAMLQDMQRRIYGSWSEFEIVAAGSVKTSAAGAGLTGMASGAAFGSYGLCLVLGTDCGTSSGSRPEVMEWSRQTIGNEGGNLGGYRKAVLATLETRIGGSQSDCTDGNTGLLNGCEYRRDLSSGAHIGRGETAVWVTGSAVIRGDITYEEGSYTSLDDLPQAVIIVHGDLVVASNVTRIDAWLIVRGTINTCDAWRIGLGINQCNNKLVFNGPVSAGRIQLNRTGGSGVNNRLRNNGCAEGINSCHGTGKTVYPYNTADDASGDPAEVFNLRGDAFLWAFQQALRGGQARTTYVREVAPRF